ncbi:hypothetical protein STASHLEY_00590 [Brevundimonas phage vB_BpoS-StAshley]|nr:hypothetical protein STASHLEY_00590 [Brevundimonas phage vB_BpoS-StAshley]UTC30076.1 hypothetical protein MAINES_00370 [Brevundimonas phage vB_BpoS-MaInes]
MSNREPFKVTATQRDGSTREWTRDNWGGICGLYNAVMLDRRDEGFTDIKLWIFGADQVWRVADLTDPDLGFKKETLE